MIYLDYAANTPVDERVLDVFVSATKKYIANPNSSHILGKSAKEEIYMTTKLLADYFNCEKDGIIYTSGSSESNNLVIKGIAERNKDKGKHIIISSVEHSSIVAPCNFLASHGFDITMISLTSDGLVDLEKLKRAMNDETILVSICSVDSELGTIQPIKEIGNIVSKYPNCVFHTDATQAIGKVNIDFTNVDFITFAPHKFFGLNGFGALVNKNNKKLIPLIHGGKSTTLYRSGTPVTANIVALGKAFELAINELNKRYEYIKNMNNYLRNELSKMNCVHINSPLNSIPNILNISLIDKDTKKILKQLEKKKIYVSKATACSIEDLPSKSVFAIIGNEKLASNTIRISISHLTKMEEINEFIKVFKKLLK